MSSISPVTLTPEIPVASSDSDIPRIWLEWLGLSFDPFGPLDAASDPRLGKYLVGHKVFARVWGDWPSWVFAPPGGGKTALRVRTAQACWVGQETNRPFPIPYMPPFLAWGHASPSLDDHFAALARAGAVALLLALAHRPHWLFRLDGGVRQTVRDVLDWNLPGPLSGYLERCRQSGSVQPLRESLAPTFVLPDPPDKAALLRWCNVLDATPGDDGVRPSPTERWHSLRDLLLNTLGFHSLYLLVDGLDAAPETTTNGQMIADCLAPLMPLVGDWAGKRIFVKGFLPLEARDPLTNQFTPVFTDGHTATIHWTPELLAEVVRRRVYVASEGSFGSLDAVASPALRDVETILAQASLPLPREILVLTRRVLEEHVRREGNGGKIQEEDVDAAIRWYDEYTPSLDLIQRDLQ